MHRNADEVHYQTVAVTRGDLTQSVTATGTLNPVINVQVGSQISGIIQKLFADYNSPVKAGQVVAQIDPATYSAVVMQAEGDLANARAELELAQINLKRTQDLRERNATPQATLDQAVASLHQAEAMVKLKEGALARANVDLQRCTIYSPIDGIVISRSVDVGQTVAASMSAPILFTIANDLAKMQIDANVAEADVGNVEVGQSVEFAVDAYPNRTFQGKINQVRNAALTVQNVVSYDTVISVSNDDLKLKPGMTANASIAVAHRENVLKLGGAAFRFRLPETEVAAGKFSANKPSFTGKRPGGKKSEHRLDRTVYLLRDGKPAPVQIKTGISDGIFTEVVEGLNEGDQVIISSLGGAQNASTVAPTNPLGGGMRLR
ncbi:MAG: efflux RND transporter periplasmic adaptor subunit [Verrucomicrobia bacterium]|nr:efflux RND transporter periplasmic adaptor subunit [Verrucomicrobiota bacterium]